MSDSEERRPVSERDSIQCAFDNVSRSLPGGYDLEITIEHGGYGVKLLGPSGESIEFGSDFENIFDEINDAINWARHLVEEDNL